MVTELSPVVAVVLLLLPVLSLVAGGLPVAPPALAPTSTSTTYTIVFLPLVRIATGCGHLFRSHARNGHCRRRCRMMRVRYFLLMVQPSCVPDCW
jgi:hypothetical protein